MSNTQNVNNSFNKKCTKKQNSLDTDNEFTGLIDGEEFLSNETKCTENIYEININQQDGQMLIENDNSNEYFLMSNVNESSNEMLTTNNHQEETFLLNTDLGTISVTLNDLIKVGVDVNNEVLHINANQANELLKLVQDRGQFPNSIEYVSNFETVSDPKIDETAQVSNYFAYIEQNGTVLLVEDKTEKQMAKFNRDELKKLGILDLNNITDAELQKLAQTALNSTTQHDNLPTTSLNGPYSKRFKITNNYIGEQVEILCERFSKTKRATIRYMRKNGMFKVQFDNGQFEWVDRSKIVKINDQTKSKQLKTVNRLKKPSDIAKSSNKLPCTDECCALCDKKITTAKPAYIIIRLPACKECSRTKAMMVEDTLNSIVQEDSSSLPINNKRISTKQN